MPRQKLIDKEFLLRIASCFGCRKPSYRQMAGITGLSVGGVRHKVEKLVREGRLSITVPMLTAGIAVESHGEVGGEY